MLSKSRWLIAAVMHRPLASLSPAGESACVQSVAGSGAERPETHLPSVRRKTPPPLPSRRSIIYRIVCQRLDSVIAGLRMSYYAKWNGFQIMAACARLLMCVIAAAACYFDAAAWETFSCLYLCDFPQRWVCWRANNALGVLPRRQNFITHDERWKM